MSAAPPELPFKHRRKVVLPLGEDIEITHAEIILAAAYVQHMDVVAAAQSVGLDVRTARQILLRDKVRLQVDAMIKLRAEAMATTADWTLAQQKKVIEAAVEKGDLHAANNGLKHLGEFHGLWGKKTNIVPPKQVYDQRQIIFMQNGDSSIEEKLKLAEALERDVVGLTGLDAAADPVLHGADEAGSVQES